MTVTHKAESSTPILLHPPLIEVIYELRWELETDESAKRMRDPSYPTLYGQLYDRLKKDFPVTEDLPSTQAHPETTPFIPRHRMRKEKEGYPLVQIGPGILTLNHIKGYSWDAFQSLALRIIESIIELFPQDQLPLNFIKSELRYVNGVPFDLSKESPLEFLQKKMHINVEVNPEFTENTSVHPRANSVGLNLTYALEKPVGHLAVSANLGQFQSKPAFIQQTLIQSFEDLVPSDVEQFKKWLEEAHETAEATFQSFFQGDLMQRFLGG